MVNNEGNAEIMGVVLLISIFVAAVALMGVTMFSAPQPEKVPAVALDFFPNNDNTSVSLIHRGGETLNLNGTVLKVTYSNGTTSDNPSVIIDGGTPDSWAHISTSSSSSSTYRIGDVINLTAPTGSIDRVQLIWPGTGGAVLLGAWFPNSSSGRNPPAAVTGAVPITFPYASEGPTWTQPTQNPIVPWVYFIANITATNGMVPINFTNLTENQGPYGLLWNFDVVDGGQIFSRETKSIEYSSYPIPGEWPFIKNYTVSLTLTNSTGRTEYSLSRPDYISVYKSPTAGFDASPLEGNSGMEVWFTNTTTGYETSLSWDFGDLNTSTNSNSRPVFPYTYYNTGSILQNYNASLIAHVDLKGNPPESSEPFQRIIKVHPQVIARFTATGTTGSAPLTVSFNGSSSGGDNLTYSWEFGDGSLSNETQPIHTYTTGGNYTVNLTVSNKYKGPNTNTTSRTINVTATTLAPVASFTANQTSGTAPLAVKFNDTSTNSPNIWNWSFGDGKTSTDQNPVHTYSTFGTYTVNLTASNTAGNSTPPATKTITVYNNQDTIRIDSWGKTNYPDKLNNTWRADQEYKTGGWGYIETAYNPIYQIGANINNTSDQTLYQTRRSNSNGPVEYRFNVPPDKTYNVQLKFAEIDSSISPSNPRTFDVMINGKVRQNFNVYDAAGGAYNATDLYYSNVAVVNNTIDVVLNSTSGNPPIISAIGIAPNSTWVSPDFTAYRTSVNAQLPIQFNDASAGTVDRWFWDFGDKTNSTSQNPSHTYSTAGTYKVMLTAGNANQSRTIVKQDFITVYQAQVAAFITNLTLPYEGNSGMNVSFTNQSTGYVTALTWDFGDGTTGTGPYPTHIFYNNSTDPATRTVTLNASNPWGSSTTTHTIIIHRPLAPSFYANQTIGNVPFPVQFTDTSTGDNITGRNWYFGDGGTSNVQNPVYQYQYPGTYPVSLTITNIWGINTTQRLGYITVRPQLVPNFTATPTIGNSPLPVLFNASTSAGANLAYTWDFGDGTSGTGLTPTHTYYNNNDTVPVYRTVTLTVGNSYGSASTTRTGLITVNPPLVANFDGFNQEGNAPLTVSLVDLSTGVKSFWNWSFGDGTTQNGTIQNVTHTYISTGNYTVSLTVGNPYGSNSMTKTNFVRVHPQLVANFTQNQTIGNQPLPVKFTDHSTGDNRTYIWDFGDGRVSNLTSPIYTYTTAGNYTINLTVKNSWGSNSTTSTITILPPLRADFSGTPTSGNSPLVVYFTDESMGSPSTWNWDFGDGTTGTGPNPQHTYMNVGSYTVTLSVTNSYGNGNSNTLSKTSYVTVIPAAPHDYIADGGAPQTRKILDTGYFMFNASNTVSGQSITVGGTPIPIQDGDRIKLVIRGDQEGAMNMTSNYISTFTFSNVDLYRNDILKATGAITHVNATVNCQVSTLILEVKAQDDLSLTVDGLGVPSGQAKKGFKIFYLTPNSKGILQYLTGSSGADYTGGGSSHTIRPP